MEPYVEHFRARWADMDFNQHMRNSAFLAWSEETRCRCMDSRGFPMSELMRLQIGPVVLEDKLSYKRELRLLEAFSVKLEVAALSEDGRKMIARNTFTKEAGAVVCAVVESVVIWLDLAARKPVVPPDALKALWADLPKTADFRAL